MAVNIVTGRRGEAHITSDDDRMRNIESFGDGKFIFDAGRQLWATKLSDNSVQIEAGMCMSHGTQMGIERSQTETVSIESGVSGYKRNDLICMRYTRDTTLDTESAELVVLKGTQTTGEPTDPTYTDGNPISGATLDDTPLWRVKLNGTAIEAIEPMTETTPLRSGKERVEPAPGGGTRPDAPDAPSDPNNPTATHVITPPDIDRIWGSGLTDGDAGRY